MIPESYLGVVVGAIIALISSLVSIFLNNVLISRREEKKIREEQQRRKIEAAHEYFRGLYNYLAPFMGLFPRMEIIRIMFETHFLGKKEMTEKEREVIISHFKDFDNIFSGAVGKMENSGIIGLLPNGLSKNLVNLTLRAAELNQIFQKNSTFCSLSKDDIDKAFRFCDLYKETRSKIRRLLNVDALEV